MSRPVAVTMISALLLSLSSPAFAEGPGERIENTIVRALDVLQGGTPHEPGNLDGRPNQLRTIINELFDWSEMSRQILSQYWESLTPLQRDQFTALFGDVIRRSYVATIHTYQGERVAMVLLEETIDGERAVVRTKLVAKSNVIPITYRLIGHEDTWKVYDVTIDGVSVLSNSRSQISRLIHHFGYGGMMTMLKTKQTQLVVEENARSTTISRVDVSQ
jgi:phospholipid transport system substrate-binding protein